MRDSGLKAASPVQRVRGGYSGDMYCWSDIDCDARHVFVAPLYLRIVEAIDQGFMNLNIALVPSGSIPTAAYMQVLQC
jgi:hypothetical protein